MEYEFDPTRLEKEYTDERHMKKKFGMQIAIGMVKFLSCLEVSIDAYDLKERFAFCMEHKKKPKRILFNFFRQKEKQMEVINSIAR